MKIERIQTVRSAGAVRVKVGYASLLLKEHTAPADPTIIRKFPAIPGNFLTGVVVDSADPAYKVGDRVVQTGWDLGENDGAGHGRYACLKSDWGIGDFYANDPLPLST